MNFLTNYFLTFADGASAAATGSDQAAAGGGPGSMLLMIGWIVALVALMYFLMWRPQKKKQKEEKKLRESLQIGDEIVTIGGIVGRIVTIKEDSIVIESPDHSKIQISTWAVQSNKTIHD